MSISYFNGKSMKPIEGIVPAVFTPMNEDGSAYLDQIQNLVNFLIHDNVAALYVCGSTGEGPSLTTEERMAVAETFVTSVNNRIPIIVNVGHNSIKEAQTLAEHAAKVGADAFSAVPPSYFKISSVENLVHCIADITSVAPNLPFYYYHIPHLTSVEVDMIKFLELCSTKIPNLVGVKYSDFKLFELQSILEFEKGKYNILFGSDEMLLSALAVGVSGAVGSTYNYAAPLYNKILKSCWEHDIEEARKLQSFAVKMVRMQYRYGGLPAFKVTMKFLNVDCGQMRLPLQKLSPENIDNLKEELTQIGFFDWGRQADS
jgi:N-acetylneuraminate lyase